MMDEIELKSEEILPKQNRNVENGLFDDNLIIDYHNALEAAELELAGYKAKEGQLGGIIQTLAVENQGLKYMIEKGNGGNCIIAPKEEVDKIAKKRYEKAEEYLEDKDTYRVSSYDLHKALKIAAGIE